MIDHLLCHTAVNADILARDKSCLVRAEKQYHVRNIHWISDSAGRLLYCISDELEAYFNENPPTDVPDAVRKIKEHFGINITATPVRYWLKAKAIRTKSQKAYRQRPI